MCQDLLLILDLDYHQRVECYTRNHGWRRSLWYTSGGSGTKLLQGQVILIDGPKALNIVSLVKIELALCILLFEDEYCPNYHAHIKIKTLLVTILSLLD